MPTAPPDYKHVPKGLPPNPLTKSPMDQLLPQAPFPAQPVPQPPPETFRPPMMENPGISNVSGQGVAAQPEWTGKLPSMQSAVQPGMMAVPAPVSAMDPAYSMHPIIKALASGGGQTLGNLYASPWQQMPPSMKRSMTKSDLITALGLPGMSGSRTQTQGSDGIVGPN